MEKLLYTQINITGIIILVILLCNQKKSVGITIQQRLFNTIIISVVWILVLDTGMWVVDGKRFLLAREANILISMAYYFFNVFIPFLWLLYCDCILNNSTQSLRKRMWLYFLPVLANTLMIIINLWYGFIFYVDTNNIYHRGKIFLLPVMTAFSYLLLSSYMALHKAHKTKIESEKGQLYLMASFILPPLVGGILQALFYGLSLIWVNVVISLLMIFVNIQNQQINTDSLTGLNNRLQFDKYLFFKTKSDNDRDVIALIMIDVDKFKQINDSYGHLCGDKALISVANVLKKSCKNKNAFLSRYGGDEFTIIYETRKLTNIQKLITQIEQNVNIFNSVSKEKFSISLSIGYAVWEKNSSVDTLIAQADYNMYRIKYAKKFF
ncbi:GGDEF domain-containing protein [Aminipila terrae]|uniref:Diguanylate cyclase n=1 Tax=Aminipila terrae TaxID=2697030 RepID=A0A6P1MGY4_9FIRM|nr:GGDEF domain-containing protein [Aminipila terrae]QHI73312.1 diguanylate cyclase [Aminipila terrae]